MTESTNTTRTIVVSASGPKSYKTVELDGSDVKKIEVVLTGATAITHLAICGNPSQAPTTEPTAAPTRKPTASPTTKPSLAPTNRPTSVPTKSPTAAPSATPSVAPSARPSGAPSVTPRSAPYSSPTVDHCVYGPRETGVVGTTKYSNLPITVLRSDNETVTFAVNQTWKVDCAVGWIATSYPVSKDNSIRCDKEIEVTPSDSFTYTATCVDNKATVSVFVYDPSFNTTDNPVVPDYCATPDSVGNKVAYNFTIPCNCDTLPVVDAPTPAPNSGACDYHDVAFDDKSLASGAFVSLQWMDRGFGITAKERLPGTGGYMPNGFPRLFDTSKAVNTAGFGTPDLAGNHGNVLVVQQTGGNTEQWKANEKGGIITFNFVTPMNEVLELGLLNVVNEVRIKVTEVGNTTRTIVVAAKGPKSEKMVELDGLDVTEIEVTMNGPTAITRLALCSESNSATTRVPTTLRQGPTSPSVAPVVATTQSPSSKPTTSGYDYGYKTVPKATNKVQCDMGIFEDYETPGQSESWQQGTEYDDEVLTNFLGRLGRNHPIVSKTFHVPILADYVDISFDLYDIDGMTSTDKVYVGIDGTLLDLNLFDTQSNGQRRKFNDIDVTRTLKESKYLSFQAEKMDTIYSIVLRVPKARYATKAFTLPISFQVTSTKDICEESYGIDNFRMTASCPETRHRQLQDSDFDMRPLSSNESTTEDDSFYCVAADFPCNDNGAAAAATGMVNVCHYSTKLGYKTFCIPEADSEMLRFNARDYCGACVGGFGNGVKHVK